LVPDDVTAKVEAVREQIQDGSFVVPVFDNIPSEEELSEAPQPDVDPMLGDEPSSDMSDMSVALILPGSVDDQSWNTGGFNAVQKLGEDLGVETAYVERIGVADVEAALRDYASQGYTLVVGHSFNYGDAIKKVAPDYPEVAFAWSQGFPPMPENVAAYSAPLEQSAYLSGMLGAYMSETGKLGYIGGAETPPMVAALGGYMAGAHFVAPDVEVIHTFPGVWDDVEKGKESARAQFSAGVDFMMGRGDGLAEGVREAAKEEDVYMIGDVVDQNELAPELIVTSTIWDLSVVYEKILEEIAAGTFEGGMYNMGMEDGATDIAPFHGLVPDDVAAKVEAVREQIQDGSFVVPVFDNIPSEEELSEAPQPDVDPTLE
jgi:basic membrane protein A